MFAFRLVKARHAATALNGEGARRVGGRWNAPGVPMVYCAASLSLAVLELLAHVGPENIPSDLVTIKVEIPDDAPVKHLLPADLPGNWKQEEAKGALQALGAEWIKAGAELALIVPSVIVPSEVNVLINPSHPDAARVRVVARDPFSLDPRLV
jgi:RES domain-containing protein